MNDKTLLAILEISHLDVWMAAVLNYLVNAEIKD